MRGPRPPGFTVMIHKDGALETRRYRIPRWLARGLTVLALSATAVVVAVVAFYGPIVVAAARTPFLEHQITRLSAENRRVGELARALDDAEARYAHLRGMLGAQVGLPDPARQSARVSQASDDRLYVAPPILAREASAAEDEPEGPSVPHRWPLAVSSFRTRGLAVGDSAGEQHPGIDLAVPAGSDVRASGGGAVRAAGTDPAYGLFVLLQHPEGYETMYGHLSRVLVVKGERVRAGQVIGLSGNTGRSTAPHLHFEVRRNGRQVDPLTLVREGT